jgi:hypothetical protein
VAAGRGEQPEPPTRGERQRGETDGWRHLGRVAEQKERVARASRQLGLDRSFDVGGRVFGVTHPHELQLGRVVSRVESPPQYALVATVLLHFGVIGLNRCSCWLSTGTGCTHSRHSWAQGREIGQMRLNLWFRNCAGTCKEWCVEMRGSRNEEHIVVPSPLFFVLHLVLFFRVFSFLRWRKRKRITNNQQ